MLQWGGWGGGGGGVEARGEGRVRLRGRGCMQKGGMERECRRGCLSRRVVAP